MASSKVKIKGKAHRFGGKKSNRTPNWLDLPQPHNLGEKRKGKQTLEPKTKQPAGVLETEDAAEGARRRDEMASVTV
jgi:hypothetical protein